MTVPKSKVLKGAITLDQAVYWLWLQQAIGYSAKLFEPLQIFGSAKALYDADETDYRNCAAFGRTRSFSEKRLSKLMDKNLREAMHTLELCQENEIQVLTPQDAGYPEQLKRILDFPAVLFVRGDLSCVQSQLSVAVIGARSPTQYSFRAAHQLAGDLAKKGVTVVSGGALGIDAAAHTGALSKGGKTVLVMGCGHFSDYLKENAELRDAVTTHGALISEYPPTVRPSPSTFPLRNRLISALSDAVVIVEAAAQSGTLNTASHAEMQRKPIFVFPGDDTSAAFEGSRTLIRNGAKTVFSAEDVLFHLGAHTASPFQRIEHPVVEFFDGIDRAETILSRTAQPKLRRKINKKTTTAAANRAEPAPQTPPAKKISNFSPESVSESAALVYNILLSGRTLFDEILLESGLPAPKVLAALTELELAGGAEKADGNRYRCTQG